VGTSFEEKLKEREHIRNKFDDLDTNLSDDELKKRSTDLNLKIINSGSNISILTPFLFFGFVIFFILILVFLGGFLGFDLSKYDLNGDYVFHFIVILIGVLFYFAGKKIRESMKLPFKDRFEMSLFIRKKNYKYEDFNDDSMNYKVMIVIFYFFILSFLLITIFWIFSLDDFSNFILFQFLIVGFIIFGVLYKVLYLSAKKRLDKLKRGKVEGIIKK
jgi:hypothetical protein